MQYLLVGSTVEVESLTNTEIQYCICTIHLKFCVNVCFFFLTSTSGSLCPHPLSLCHVSVEPVGRHDQPPPPPRCYATRLTHAREPPLLMPLCIPWFLMSFTPPPPSLTLNAMQRELPLPSQRRPLKPDALWHRHVLYVLCVKWMTGRCLQVSPAEYQTFSLLSPRGRRNMSLLIVWPNTHHPHLSSTNIARCVF